MAPAYRRGSTMIKALALLLLLLSVSACCTIPLPDMGCGGGSLFNGPRF
jgi:hypothetical protein